MSIPESGKINPELAALQEEYEVVDLPKLVLEETWDAEKEELLEQYRIQEFKATDFKLDKLIKFLKPFARKTAKPEVPEILEQKEQSSKRDEKLFVSMRFLADFEKMVLADTEPWLVYFTTSAEEDLTSEYKYFNKLTRQIQGAVKVGVFRFEKDDAELKKKLKVAGLDAGKPKIRFYPNNAVDE